MKFTLIFILLFSFSSLFSENRMQESATAPPRTPEQEATTQTQKMTEELDLSKKQSEALYKINLRHARERQISNSRADALERSRKKNEAMQEVLSPEQYKQLQNRRIQHSPNTSMPQRNATQQRNPSTVMPQRNATRQQRSPQQSSPPAENRQRPPVRK